MTVVSAVVGGLSTLPTPGKGCLEGVPVMAEGARQVWWGEDHSGEALAGAGGLGRTSSQGNTRVGWVVLTQYIEGIRNGRASVRPAR